MSTLAITGHATRGSEVIECLEMLGGINFHNFYGDESYAYYTIDSDKEIKGGSYVFGDEQLCHFTLEQFEEKFPYKVGDKVKNARVNDFIGIITNAQWDINEEQIIYKVEWDDITKSTLNYFARGLQPYKEETMEKRDKAMAPNLVGEDYSGKRFGYKIPQGYEFDCIQNNEIIIKPIKPQYPKTYEECCEVLGKTKAYQSVSGYKTELLEDFQKLLICRDAYWKIAGEQMGLGKPWKPDWKNDEQGRYMIMVYENKLYKDMSIVGTNFILVFPTEEMRDAFYENFKDLIENVKELL